MKECKICKIQKLESEFYPKHASCKTCLKSIRKRVCQCQYCKKSYFPEKQGSGRFCSMHCRFYTKVRKHQNGCWNWLGGKTSHRYRSFQCGKQNKLAHRISWELHFGSILDNIEVCHKCDNGFCVNPEHLFLGTHDDNMKDASEKKKWIKTRKLKIPLEEHPKIRELYLKGITQVQLRKTYKCGEKTMQKIIRNQYA